MRFRNVIVGVCFSLVFVFFFHACNGNGGGTQQDSNPSISTLNPPNVVMGGVGFTITVNGSRFVSDSVVRWNGQNRPTTFISSTRLTAPVYTQDVASARNVLVSVYNPSPNEGTSNSVTFRVDSNDDNWVFLGVPTISGTEYYDVGQILVDPENEQIMYVMVYGEGLFLSGDGGGSWDLAVPGEPPSYGVVSQDPENPDRLFYGQHNKLYVSNDRGITWSLNHTFNVESYIETITFSRFYPDTIYVGPRGSNVMFHRSEDDGVSWQSYSYGQTVGIDNFIPWAVAEDPVDGTLYAGVELGNHPQPYHPPFLRSIDGGETWENLVEGMTSYYEGPIWHVTSIVVHPDTRKVYAISEGAGLYTSTDQGLSWSYMPESELIGGLDRDPNQAGRLFAGSVYYGSREGGVYISTDDGENFYPFGLQGYNVISKSLTGDGGHLYAAAYQSGVYYTPLP